MAPLQIINGPTSFKSLQAKNQIIKYNYCFGFFLSFFLFCGICICMKKSINEFGGECLDVFLVDLCSQTSLCPSLQHFTLIASSKLYRKYCPVGLLQEAINLLFKKPHCTQNVTFLVLKWMSFMLLSPTRTTASFPSETNLVTLWVESSHKAHFQFKICRTAQIFTCISNRPYFTQNPVVQVSLLFSINMQRRSSIFKKPTSACWECSLLFFMLLNYFNFLHPGHGLFHFAQLISEFYCHKI